MWVVQYTDERRDCCRVISQPMPLAAYAHVDVQTADRKYPVLEPAMLSEVHVLALSYQTTESGFVNCLM